MRSFQPGDQVLVFEPSTDKLEPQWCGPYAVTDKLNDVTYRVKTPERRKQVRQYHVNSLKAWNALPQVAMVTYCEEETEEEADGEPYLYLFERGDQVDPEINTDLTEAQRGQVQQSTRMCSVVSREAHTSLHTALPQGRPSQSPTSPGEFPKCGRRR